jgi:prefoldin subunit 4
LPPATPRTHPLDVGHPRRYKIDTTFVHLPASEALEHLQAALEKIRTEVDALETEKQECEDKMDELKKDLYAKFGSKWTGRTHPLSFAPT